MNERVPTRAAIAPSSLLRNVTLRQLHVFATAAHHLSFAKAAEQLHLTQPAVSVQLKLLADAVGLPLFERIGKRLYLTGAGDELLRLAERIIASMRDADDAFASIKHLNGGRVHIAIVSTAKYFGLKLIARYSQKHPEIELVLSVGNREELLALLQRNDVDLAIMGRPPVEMETMAEPFAKHPHVVVAPADHPLAGKRGIAVSALADETWITREQGSGTRSAMQHFFADHRVKPKLGMVVASNETVKQAVMAGLGLSFLSLHTLALELQTRQIAILDVKDMPVMRTWYVVHLKSKQLSPAARAFKDFILSEGSAYLDTEFKEQYRVFKRRVGGR